MTEEQKKEPDSQESATDAEKQKELIARLTVAKGDNKNHSVPFHGALIKIDNIYYEPSQLRISSFAINPYSGMLIAGQMFQCSVMLPGETEPYEVAVAGAVKTIDESFGLRAVFGEPQPAAQHALALHLIAIRKFAEAAKIAAKAPVKKKGFW